MERFGLSHEDGGCSVNGDKGSYQLSHTSICDKVFATDTPSGKQ